MKLNEALVGTHPPTLPPTNPYQPWSACTTLLVHAGLVKGTYHYLVHSISPGSKPACRGRASFGAGRVGAMPPCQGHPRRGWEGRRGNNFIKKWWPAKACMHNFVSRGAGQIVVLNNTYFIYPLS
uniref:Uncharacterized protein n=1 Tax=Morchella brunnea TaxID=1174671 RepID=A0A8K1I7F4_9PEZI|nr:hypothetical protein LK370_mgp055 [Morchella brunnea]UBU98457.1 hypothetical protein [Morchella brunnea]